MKKIKLLAIVPYEGLAEAVSAVAKKYEKLVDATIKLGDLQEGLACGLRAQPEGYDVVLSRGGTAELLLRNLTLPVVNIEVSGYDYMRAIKMATAIPGMKAIVGHASITSHAQSVSSLLNADIQIKTVQSSDDIQQQLKILMSEGCSLVIGDVATYRIAREMGMNAMLITSGEESISSAFETSLWLMQSFGRQKNHTQMMESLLRNSRTVSAIFDDREQLRFESRPLTSIGLSAQELVPLLRPLPQKQRTGLVLQNEENLYHITLTPESDETGSSVYLFDILHQKPEKPMNLRGVRIENYRMLLHGAAELFDASGVFDAETVKDAIAFSRTNKPLLITGHSGIGKNQIARCMHRYSESWALPFVQIDCDIADPVEALREMNPESGTSVLHDGATLCFSSIDQLLPPRRQALYALLSGLDTERFRLVATARAALSHPGDSSEAGSKLEQLFCLRLHISGSTRTGRDMERFVNLNIIEFNSSYGKQIVGMEQDAMKLLLQYPWGSDFESLRRAVGQMVLLSQSSFITTTDVRRVMLSCCPTSEEGEISLKGTLAEIELKVIHGVLREEKDNYSRTAARLGIGRSTLWRKLGNTAETEKTEK